MPSRIGLTAAPGPRSTREKLAPATRSRCYVANFPCIYLYPHATNRPRNRPQFSFLSYSVFVFVFSHGFVILFDRMSKINEFCQLSIYRSCWWLRRNTSDSRGKSSCIVPAMEIHCQKSSMPLVKLGPEGHTGSGKLKKK